EACQGGCVLIGPARTETETTVTYADEPTQETHACRPAREALREDKLKQCERRSPGAGRCQQDKSRGPSG
ncbi:hypothetical protein INR49_029317, partial [Caranx melampygus]